MAQENILDVLINNTEPSSAIIGKRLPLFVWTRIPTNLSDEQLRIYLKALDERNIVLLTGWSIVKNDIEKSVNEALRIDKIRKELGIPVFVDATGIVYRFFDGTDETAHIDNEGKLFFDTSFSKGVKIGCPFRIESRYPVIKKRIEKFLEAYKKEDIEIDYWAIDWEVDGPMEWNDAWENSKKCIVCKRNIKNIDNFTEFQKMIRKKRAELQKEVFVKTVQKFYPKILIGNYGVNPHDGYRYWWDYFEKEVSKAVYQKKHNALHRKWFDEFKYSGYTMAMPVIYTWYRFFSDYTFKPEEYRWFYPLIKEATSVGKETSEKIPIITFIHWQTVLKPKRLPVDFQPMSKSKYKELLWHMLLRGHDTFCVWSPQNEMAEEIRAAYEVYIESLKYNDFILNGKPIFWDVPEEPDTIISGIRLKNKLLIMRTDFDDSKEIKIKLNNKILIVPPVSGLTIININ